MGREYGPMSWDVGFTKTVCRETGCEGRMDYELVYEQRLSRNCYWRVRSADSKARYAQETLQAIRSLRMHMAC